MAELSSASCWLGAWRLLSCSGLRFGAPFAKRWRLRLRWTAIQLVHDLREVIAGLGGLAEGEAFGIEVIGHAPITNLSVANGRFTASAQAERRHGGTRLRATHAKRTGLDREAR